MQISIHKKQINHYNTIKQNYNTNNSINNTYKDKNGKKYFFNSFLTLYYAIFIF